MLSFLRAGRSDATTLFGDRASVKKNHICSIAGGPVKFGLGKARHFAHAF
jgi:hypothetical protein